MSIAIITIITSFILDGIISNHQNYTLIAPSIFKTIFTIIALVNVYPYFHNDKKYILLLLITGIFFDIVYAGTFMFVTIIFIIIYYVHKFIDFFLPFNLLNINIISCISIFIYHLLSFCLLNVFKYNSYDINLLINIIVHSVLGTIIYTTIMYCILKRIYDKYNIKHIR